MANIVTDNATPQMTSREFMLLVHLQTIMGLITEETAATFDAEADEEYGPGFKALPRLFERGYVQRDRNGYVLLTRAGHQLLAASGSHWKP